MSAQPLSPMSAQPLSENEIRPEALMAEQARLFAEDVARLMARRSEFVEAPCPACGIDESNPAFEKTGMSFVVCRACETLYANPRPSPALMADYYRHSANYAFWSQHIFPASEAARREKIFQPRVRQVLELCERFRIPARTLLEVGAGFGLFCEEMMKTGYFDAVAGVEPVPYLAEDCRRRGVRVIEKPVEEIAPEELVALGSIDVLASFEVIEHLFSPGDFLLQCERLLAPGGILILSCPNSKGFEVMMLREKSTTVDIEHVNLFTPDSLGLLLASCGFEVLERRTPGALDAELVRKQWLAEPSEADAHPFLKHILLDVWAEKGAAFQDFLAANGLSSHMLLVARKSLG